MHRVAVMQKNVHFLHIKVAVLFVKLTLNH